MRFHWIAKRKTDPQGLLDNIELKYKLRTKITKFLLSKLGTEYDGDFSRFHFNLDVATERITLLDKTPAVYFKRIAANFKAEINQE